MATVLDLSNGNGTTKGAATPPSDSASETGGHSPRSQENGSEHLDASLLTSGLLQPAPHRDLAPVELTALQPPPRPFEAPSPAPRIGFTDACSTVRAGGRTYPVVGHCAYGPIVVVERDVKGDEEPEEEPADECSRRIYHLNPSPLFGIGTVPFHLLILLYAGRCFFSFSHIPVMYIVHARVYCARLL